MKIKELLNKLNSIVNANPQMLEAKVLLQIDGEHIYTTDIDNINIVDDNVVLEGEW